MWSFVLKALRPFAGHIIYGGIVLVLAGGLVGAAVYAKNRYDFGVAESARAEFIKKQLEQNNEHLRIMTQLYQGLLEASNRHTQELQARNQAAQEETEKILEEIRAGKLQGTDQRSSEVLRQTIRRLRGE